MKTCQIVAVLSAMAVCAVAVPIFVDGGPRSSVAESGESYAPKDYKFDYAVHDPETYDVKSQWEAREGEVVKGAYSVLDPDGAMRLVEYTADPESGFNAVVSRSDSGNTGYRKPSNDAFDF
ncbi:cuticle protein 19-like [Adelges cooleyi]|uniref:cuticle protein 19-like n=1 Tax=Adelges cooleyi TaxID=133065 RepID=UPI00217FD69B|nr:cuticle protein 19-like [Adelges cooleyi]